jgi:hypothetical protein
VQGGKISDAPESQAEIHGMLEEGFMKPVICMLQLLSTHHNCKFI